MGGAPSKILPTLWQGGDDVLQDDEFFEKHGITHVLSVCPESPAGAERKFTHLHIPVNDFPGANLHQFFPAIVAFLMDARISGATTYVHCAAGISRSSTATLAFLMTHLGVSMQDAFKFLQIRRESVSPNPGFRKQLRFFESGDPFEPAEQTGTVAFVRPDQDDADAELSKMAKQLAERFGMAGIPISRDALRDHFSNRGGQVYKEAQERDAAEFFQALADAKKKASDKKAHVVPVATVPENAQG